MTFVIGLAAFALMFFGASGIFRVVLKVGQRESARAGAGFTLIMAGIVMILYVFIERP